MPHLAIEYRQWKFCQALLQIFLRASENHTVDSAYLQKEAKTILERMILSINQEANLQRDVELPLFPKISIVHTIIKKLIKDVQEKGFCSSERTGTILFTTLLREIEDFRQHCHLGPPPTTPDVEMLKLTSDTSCSKTYIQIGEFKTPASVRFPFLVSRYGLNETAAMVLRYESAGNGSYQWGDPISVHKLYYVDFGARYEGFASPLNSRFLGQKDARFCSLFIETDAVFGSLGNFFSVDMSQYTGGWSVNPPFIETILEAAARKVINTLKANLPSYFFMNYPHWTDSVGWQLLNESQFRVERFDFIGHRQEFLVQDAYGRGNNPKMNLSIFVMGKLPDHVPAVAIIRKAMMTAGDRKQ